MKETSLFPAFLCQLIFFPADRNLDQDILIVLLLKSYFLPSHHFLHLHAILWFMLQLVRVERHIVLQKSTICTDKLIGNLLNSENIKSCLHLKTTNVSWTENLKK